MAAAHCTKTEAAHIQCYFDRTLQPQFFFLNLNLFRALNITKLAFLFQEVLLLIYLVITFYFCPGWLSNRIMNNILAVVLMDPSDIIMLPSERFIKGPANHFCSPDGDS